VKLIQGSYHYRQEISQRKDRRENNTRKITESASMERPLPPPRSGLVQFSFNLIAVEILAAFCPWTRSNKPQELPFKEALGVRTCMFGKASITQLQTHVTLRTCASEDPLFCGQEAYSDKFQGSAQLPKGRDNRFIYTETHQAA
jgi:hypothetical protein